MGDAWGGRGDAGSRLEDLLRADPSDCGCDVARGTLDVYATAVVAGAPARARFPGVAAHLEGCAQCRDDLTGLVAALTAG